MAEQMANANLNSTNGYSRFWLIRLDNFLSSGIENEKTDEVKQDWLMKQDLTKLDPTKLTPLTDEVN